MGLIRKGNPSLTVGNATYGVVDRIKVPDSCDLLAMFRQQVAWSIIKIICVYMIYPVPALSSISLSLLHPPGSSGRVWPPWFFEEVMKAVTPL